MGTAPLDIAWCLDHPGVIRRAALDSGIELDLWVDGGQTWAEDHPDEFRMACAGVVLEEDEQGVIDRLDDVFGAESTRLIEEGLSDVERVWCFGHVDDVLFAAEVLRVGPETVLPGLLGVSRDAVDSLSRESLFWYILAPDAFVRSCATAFEAR